MAEQTLPVRKTFTYKLTPTPEQDRGVESVVWHCCRTLYHATMAGREQRRT